jgi:hypothetical protein
LFKNQTRIGEQTLRKNVPELAPNNRAVHWALLTRLTKYEWAEATKDKPKAEVMRK